MKSLIPLLGCIGGLRDLCKLEASIYAIVKKREPLLIKDLFKNSINNGSKRAAKQAILSLLSGGSVVLTEDFKLITAKENETCLQKSL